jgi:hypothetical protein
MYPKNRFLRFKMWMSGGQSEYVSKRLTREKRKVGEAVAQNYTKSMNCTYSVLNNKTGCSLPCIFCTKFKEVKVNG